MYWHVVSNQPKRHCKFILFPFFLFDLYTQTVEQFFLFKDANPSVVTSQIHAKHLVEVESTEASNQEMEHRLHSKKVILWWRQGGLTNSEKTRMQASQCVDLTSNVL